MNNVGKEAFLIWITGLSGSGKTILGKKVYEALKKKYKNIIFLDGDDFREILGNDLSHSQKDRLENAKRIHKMCKFLVSQNINVICATMSLYSEIHELNRKEIKTYFEVFIECNIHELIKRNQKELYSEALEGKRNDVVGINLSYDKPQNCELIIENSEKNNLEQKVKKVLNLVEEYK